MKPVTNALICLSLAIGSGVNIATEHLSDASALDRLRGYATDPADVTAEYAKQRDAWTDAVGGDLFESSDYATFAAQQSKFAMEMVDADRAEIEKAAIDGFSYWWSKKKAKPLIKKVRAVDVAHAEHAGQSAVIQMAKSTCDGVTVAKKDYEAAGLTTAASVAVYEDVVKTWTKDACEKVGWPDTKTNQ